jgi:alpha-beta hydrolase superfamily lysophospholipase
VLTIVIAACAPPMMDARPAAPKSDNGIQHETRVTIGVHDTPLFEQSWRPSSTPRAVLVIHHGLKSHSDHYAEFAGRLVAKGFAVHAYDMRGHGRSAGMRAALDDFEDLTADLSNFVERVRAREGNAPIFVMGHSVGGAVVSLYTVERKPNIAGLILLAPAIRVDRMPLEAAFTPMTVALLPNLPLVDVPDEFFSRSPAVVEEMGKDPLIYHPAGPARTAGGLLAALEKVWAGVETVEVPVFALHGTADKATDPRGSAEFIRRVHSTDRTLKLYPGLYHDLVREPERETVMHDLEEWLEHHAPAR